MLAMCNICSSKLTHCIRSNGPQINSKCKLSIHDCQPSCSFSSSFFFSRKCKQIAICSAEVSTGNEKPTSCCRYAFFSLFFILCAIANNNVVVVALPSSFFHFTIFLRYFFSQIICLFRFFSRAFFNIRFQRTVAEQILAVLGLILLWLLLLLLNTNFRIDCNGSIYPEIQYCLNTHTPAHSHPHIALTFEFNLVYVANECVCVFATFS